ncbi:DUF2332 domain-containing protein [Nocardia crassostreae]|uniref:DUF2332 domain-containing protein n=1 Tax=Nocardia crassostreae TaxID=53428 RepID=UPI0008320D32|nr:DUF2332 domain-containing protein [Nocardia crassostreae]
METAERYRLFAEQQVRGYSPCYEQWALGIASDPALLTLIDELPVPKRQPNLVLAAARYTGAEAASCAEFKDFLTRDWPDIREIIMTHRTQTNEAGRAATLLPLLNLCVLEPKPVALIEIGPSAGLCLYPDRYSYGYDDHPILDPPSGRSPVLLSCTTSGAAPIPRSLPEIVHRTGVDLHPIDVHNPADMRWLECLVWPEQQDRLDRLRTAAAIVRQDPPHLVTGNLTDTIADLVHAAPRDAEKIVFSSAVQPYLTPAERLSLQETINTLDCHWITSEGSAVLDFGPTPLPAPPNSGVQFIQALDGTPRAYAAPHGQTLDWFAQ